MSKGLSKQLRDSSDTSVKASAVQEVEVFAIPELSVSSKGTVDVEEWVRCAKWASRNAAQILTMPFDTFWSSVVHSPKIGQFIDVTLAALPRSWEEDQWKAIFSARDDIRGVACELYERLLLIILRIILHREDEKTFLSESFYSQTIYDYGIFTPERIFDIIALYGSANAQIVDKIVSAVLLPQPKYIKTTMKYFSLCAQFLNESMRSLEELTKPLLINGNERAFNDVVEQLSPCIAIFEGIHAVIPYFHSSDVDDGCASLIESIPQFVDRVSEIFSDDTISQLTVDRARNSRELLRILDVMLCSSLRAYHSMISRCSVDERVVGYLHDCVAYERFVFYYNLLYPLSELLARLKANDVCTERQTEYVDEAVSTASAARCRAIINKLASNGLLTKLGKPTDAKVRHLIDDLAELLPQYSPQFIHLCARHYGYDNEAVTEALLDTSLLPLDLRALATVELTAMDPPPGIGYFSTADHDGGKLPEDSADQGLLEEACASENPYGGLICMKPPTSTDSAKVRQAAASGGAGTVGGNVAAKQRPTIDDALKKAAVDERPQWDVGNDTRVPEQESSEKLTRLRGIEKFIVPDSEKIALRPTYEKYFYEDHSAWDDYDDEYDDTFDDRQSYSVDPRQGDLPVEELAGVERNRNRDIPQEEDMEGETDGENRRGGNSARFSEGAGNPDDIARGRGRRMREQQAKRDAKIAAGGGSEGTAESVASLQKADAVSAPAVDAPESAGTTASGGGNRQTTVHSDRNDRRGYTGGRERQMKERHKGSDRRRQADRKMRGGMF